MNALPEDDQTGRAKMQINIDELIGNNNVGMAVSTKEGYELIEIEEAVKQEQGCWIRFLKYPAA